MNIILNNADFSGNNLGQAPIEIEYTAQAQALFDAYATSLTTPQKNAIQAFLNNVNADAGLTAKVTDVYLPLFGATDGWVNVIDTVAFAYPASGYATYDANGINFIQGFEMPFTSQLNSHFFYGYNTTALTLTSAPKPIFSRSDFSGYLGRLVSTNNAGYFNSSTTNAVVSGATSVAQGGVMGNSFSSESLFMTIVDGTTALDPQGDFISTGTDNYVIGSTSEGNTANVPDNAYGCFAWGTGLTQAEAEALDGFLNDLNTALLA